MNISDDLFKRVEKKTKIKKETILDLANKLNNGNMKNEATIREVITTLSTMTGKSISKEKEDKIVKAVINQDIPKNVEKMF